jgi:hypothetical protein
MQAPEITSSYTEYTLYTYNFRHIYICICKIVIFHLIHSTACMLWCVRVAPLIICGFFDHLHRFIGSLLNICNYTELPHIQACHSTQPILTLSYTVYLQESRYPFRSNGFIAQMLNSLTESHCATLVFGHSSNSELFTELRCWRPTRNQLWHSASALTSALTLFNAHSRWLTEL